MNYCNKCGAVLRENDFVCPNCGEPAPGTIPAAGQSKRKFGFGKVMIGVAILTVLIIAGIFIYNKVNATSDISNDDGYKDVLHSLVNNLCVTQDPKELQSLFVPAEVEYYIQEQYDGDENKLLENMQAFYDRYKEATSGGYVSATWDIRDQKDLTGTELKAYRKAFQKKYHTEDKITYAKAVQINITAKTAAGKSDKETAMYVLAYIDGAWYLSME